MIPFSPPHISTEAIDEVIDTLKSGWITTGPKTRLFEDNISQYCGNKRTLCVSSATFGLEMVLRWFDIGEGDEVIIPAYTYGATGNVVCHTGATLRIVDVNHDDFNINIEEVRKAINEKTKAIIPVDVAGLPVNYSALFDLVNEKSIRNLFIPSGINQSKLKRILILGDSAHSFGAYYKDMRIGSVADATVFSFHAVKNLTTAEGGAIALSLGGEFDNNEVYSALRINSLHGQNKDALAKTDNAAWRYDILNNGYKGNMTDIQASLGLVALKYYDSEAIPKRKSIISIYNKTLGRYPWAELPIFEDESRSSSYHLYTLRIKAISEKQRDQIIQEIFDRGISVNVHFQPLPMLTAFKVAGFNIENYPISYDNYSREISLPVYQDLAFSDTNKVLEAVIQSVEKVLNDG